MKKTMPASVTTETTTKAEFMKARLDWAPVEALKLPLEWIGSDLFVKLDELRRARISIEAFRCVDHYNQLLVRVLNKREGEVDAKGFMFHEHLGGVPRKDDHPNREQRGYLVISHTGWDWYIAVPETTAPLTEAVAAYLAMFQ